MEGQSQRPIRSDAEDSTSHKTCAMPILKRPLRQSQQQAIKADERRDLSNQKEERTRVIALAPLSRSSLPSPTLGYCSSAHTLFQDRLLGSGRSPSARPVPYVLFLPVCDFSFSYRPSTFPLRLPLQGLNLYSLLNDESCMSRLTLSLLASID